MYVYAPSRHTHMLHTQNFTYETHKTTSKQRTSNSTHQLSCYILIHYIQSHPRTESINIEYFTQICIDFSQKHTDFHALDTFCMKAQRAELIFRSRTAARVYGSVDKSFLIILNVFFRTGRII